MKKPKIAAIIPVYNEAKRIGRVLEILTRIPLLNEIIVVDDGSTDNTEEVIKSFNVKYLKNPTNQGKGIAMQNGVNATKADILFFCDGDLDGLNEKIVEEILNPVIEGNVDMFIGVRSNVRERYFKFVGLLSGERAVRRNIWDNLPCCYKHHYRIEISLNNYSKYYGKGFGFKTFSNYFQPIKEFKYGFFKGLGKRLGMYYDIFWAQSRFQLVDLPKPLKQLRGYAIKAFLCLGPVGSGLALILTSSLIYSALLRFIQKAIFENPGTSFTLFLLNIIKYVTVHTIILTGSIILGIGLLLLLINVIRFVRAFFKRQKVWSC
jgi:glycosyltransferase involved in cell wall biosynthesis